MLVLSRKEGESIRIADDIEVTVTRISGNRVTLGLSAPRNVRIRRNELPPRAMEFGTAPGDRCHRFGCSGTIATEPRRGVFCPACGWDTDCDKS